MIFAQAPVSYRIMNAYLELGTWEYTRLLFEYIHVLRNVSSTKFASGEIRMKIPPADLGFLDNRQTIPGGGAAARIYRGGSEHTYPSSRHFPDLQLRENKNPFSFVSFRISYMSARPPFFSTNFFSIVLFISFVLCQGGIVVRFQQSPRSSSTLPRGQSPPSPTTTEGEGEQVRNFTLKWEKTSIL